MKRGIEKRGDEKVVKDGERAQVEGMKEKKRTGQIYMPVARRLARITSYGHVTSDH